jgi:hypothetical protein
MKRLRLDFDKNARDQFEANEKCLLKIENAHKESIKQLKKEYFDIIILKDKEVVNFILEFSYFLILIWIN